MQDNINSHNIIKLLKGKDIKTPYLESLYLIIISIINLYNEDNIDDLINKTTFIFDNTDNIKKSIQGYRNEKALTKVNIKDNLDINYTLVINLDYKPTTYQIIEYLAHELNYIYCSLKQTFIKKDDDLIFHNGLFVSSVKSNKSYGKTLNEVYNCYQSEKIIEYILNINPTTLEADVYMTLMDIKENIPKHIRSPRYPNEVALFREFLSNKQIKKIVDTNIKNGNVLVIEEVFNSILGKDSYQDLNNKLDSLSDYLHKSKKLKVKEISILNCEIRNIISNFTSNYKEA